MDTIPTQKPDSQAEDVPDLPVAPDQANEVRGGKGKPLLSKYATKGKPKSEVE